MDRQRRRVVAFPLHTDQLCRPTPLLIAGTASVAIVAATLAVDDDRASGEPPGSASRGW
jgi:hypothetical protein